MDATTVSAGAGQDDNITLPEIAGRFVLSLIQALLRTGYYLPDHPESRKAKSGIYENFAILSKRSGEISLYIGEDRGRRAILIEGVDDTPTKLAAIMQQGMAETYMPRIIQFLERKELVCLTLQAGLDENEFCQLIDILSEPPSHDLDGVAARVLFVESLKQKNIKNISFIFREDIISTRTNLPWRVRMALSRLKKDLRLIPILRNLGEDELHHVKIQVLHDILRPLTVPELAYAFLLHLDMAVSSIVSEELGEQSFFEIASDNLIVAVAGLFMRDATTKGGFPEQITSAKKTRLLAELCRHLGSMHDHKAAALLEEFFENGLIALEDLPDAVKSRIEIIKRLGVFLGQTERFLSTFDSLTDPAVYQSRSRILASFVPILMERKQVGEAVMIIEVIARHAAEQSQRAALAIACRSAIASGTALGLASSLFLTASKELRTLLGRLFSLIGSEAIPHMQSILTGSDDPWKSKQAAEVLINMGDHAVEGLLSSVEGNQISHTSLAAVVRVISECIPVAQKNSAADLLLKLVNDSRVNIRIEALSGLGKIAAAGNFSLFKARLEDPDCNVRKAAINGIGRSGDRRAETLLQALIEKALKSGSDEDQQLAAVSIEALGTLMKSCQPVYDAGLACLSSLVERSGERRIWKKLLTGSFELPDCMLFALTETLGRLRGEIIQKHLSKLSLHHVPAVAKRARELCSIQLENQG